jgi:peptidoglycan/xylan/chitin deacetylase (PgdA/CDA1 family)
MISFFAMVFTNCTVSIASDDFVVVQPKKGDSFTSLAAVHLGDPSKGWLIQEFNQTSQMVYDKKLVIPVKPYNLGGLTPQGYQRVPVLSYHQFSKKSSSKMMVTASAFDEQMKYLQQNGYRVITIDQFFDFLELKVQIPKKAVLITIDDGYRSVYDIAYPILKKYAFPATIFIYTDFVGSSDAMSWDQLKELSQNGFSIQSQSKTHRDLTRRKNKESFENYVQALKDEINLSRDLLRTKLNIDCQYLAYPYGKKNDLVVAMLMKAGFRGAFTAKRVSNPFFTSNFDIGRAMILGKYDLKQFEENLVVFTKEDLK